MINNKTQIHTHAHSQTRSARTLRLCAVCVNVEIHLYLAASALEQHKNRTMQAKPKQANQVRMENDRAVCRKTKRPGSLSSCIYSSNSASADKRQKGKYINVK